MSRKSAIALGTLQSPFLRVRSTRETDSDKWKDLLRTSNTSLSAGLKRVIEQHELMPPALQKPMDKEAMDIFMMRSSLLFNSVEAAGEHMDGAAHTQMRVVALDAYARGILDEQLTEYVRCKPEGFLWNHLEILREEAASAQSLTESVAVEKESKASPTSSSPL